jgi:hypothetical protein
VLVRKGFKLNTCEHGEVSGGKIQSVFNLSRGFRQSPGLNEDSSVFDLLAADPHPHGALHRPAERQRIH